MKPATSTLAEMRGGLLNEELGEALREATAAVRQTGRKASVKLEIIIEPYDGDEGDIERVSVKDKITLKKPEPKKRDSVFFINTNLDLQRQQTIGGVEDITEKKATGKDAAAGKDD